MGRNHQAVVLTKSPTTSTLFTSHIRCLLVSESSFTSPSWNVLARRYVRLLILSKCQITCEAFCIRSQRRRAFRLEWPITAAPIVHRDFQKSGWIDCSWLEQAFCLVNGDIRNRSSMAHLSSRRHFSYRWNELPIAYFCDGTVVVPWKQATGIGCTGT
jgi:hypothetical protein